MITDLIYLTMFYIGYYVFLEAAIYWWFEGMLAAMKFIEANDENLSR